MLNIATYVENLSDEALYKKLKSHGVPAGPVVESTRRLYRRKLMQILENQDKHTDENCEDDEPLRSQSDSSRWSHITTSSSPHQSYEQEEVSSRLNLSNLSPTYRRYEDDTKPRFSYLDSQHSSRLSGSTLFSGEPSYYSFRKSLSGIRDEDSASRLRKTYTDIQSQSDLSRRYRLPGFSEEHAARMARHNREQSKQSLRLIMCGALVVAAVLVLYILYNAWSDNDPYRQIEEEAKKLIEETDS